MLNVIVSPVYCMLIIVSTFSWFVALLQFMLVSPVCWCLLVSPVWLYFSFLSNKKSSKILKNSASDCQL